MKGVHPSVTIYKNVYKMCTKSRGEHPSILYKNMHNMCTKLCSEHPSMTLYKNVYKIS
jgi:hypothetical protein